MTLDFETWQKRECERLGISIDDHNEILEVSKRIEAVGLGWAYDYIISIIEPPAMSAELAATIAQAITPEPTPPQKLKSFRKQKYVSKKS